MGKPKKIFDALNRLITKDTNPILKRLRVEAAFELLDKNQKAKQN